MVNEIYIVKGIKRIKDGIEFHIERIEALSVMNAAYKFEKICPEYELFTIFIESDPNYIWFAVDI